MYTLLSTTFLQLDLNNTVILFSLTGVVLTALTIFAAGEGISQKSRWYYR